MKTRVALGIFVFIFGSRTFAQLPTAERQQATVAYLHSLQKENGGYAADNKPDTPATLPATSSCLRAIRYFGGEPRRLEECTKFVGSCLDPSTGAFAATPGGKPEIRTTVIGIMAMHALKARFGERDEARMMRYLNDNARSFEDVRISAAAVEVVGFTVPKADIWIKQIEGMRNPDGTYGKKGNVARDTGSSLAALLRLSKVKTEALEIPNRQAAIQAMKDGQLADGGFGKEGQPGSDLESTYRVTRAFYMLKEKPNVEACQRFIAKCRNEDGSYGAQPGQPGSAASTYHAGIILYWLSELK